MNDKEIKFEKLTPINNFDLGIYEKAMDYIFDNNDIVNIAITGPYASGKSSMLMSYENIHKEKKFLHISLAHFDGKDEDSTIIKSKGEQKSSSNGKNNNNDKSIYDENLLEGKILNQLIQQIDDKDIPQTNFKIKKGISKREGIWRTTFICIFLLSISYNLLYTKWYNFISDLGNSTAKNLLNNTLGVYYRIIFGLVSILMMSYIIYKLVCSQRYKHLFKKVNIQGNEIEVFEENKDSYFDKYLNEVLYLFENCKQDIIVFEDIDRYNCNKIFEKLREINKLVNCRTQESLRFLYLLKDDMFESKDRTKFFDFIIPVIPVIDGSNSYDKFIDQFKKGGVYELFDSNFLSDISLYVDDMRLLKNIYNEFIIYYNRLEKHDMNNSEEKSDSSEEKLPLDNNKLLSMIIYKNIFPKDFSELQVGQGYVYSIFKYKENILQDIKSNYDEDINTLNTDNMKIKSETLRSIDELDALYFKIDREIRIAGKELSQYQNNSEAIKALKEKNYKAEWYDDRYCKWKSIDYSSIFKQLKSNPEYLKRKKSIDDKFNEMINYNKNKITEIHKEYERLRNSYLKDIINRDNEEYIFMIKYTNSIGEVRTFNEIKRSPYFALIKYLIRYGYIDENYSDYMTYFYPNSLSLGDKQFLLSITNRCAKDFVYKLKDCRLILTRIKLVDFLEEEILNYDILRYLLNNKDNYNDELGYFFDNVIKSKRQSFIEGFWLWCNNKDKILLVGALNNKWNEACLWFINNNGFEKNSIKEYIQKTLIYCDESLIKKNNNIQENETGSIITKYINSNAEFYDVTSSDYKYLKNNKHMKKFVNMLKTIQIKMKFIDYEKSNKTIFTEVYKNNLYEINFNMISLILRNTYQIKESDEYKTRNYSLIMTNKDEPISGYINNNINEYFNAVFGQEPKFINDKEEWAIELINRDDFEDTLKDKYIDLLDTKIQSINDINNIEIWPGLLERLKVSYCSKNILDYYFSSSNELDDKLIDFINLNSEKISIDLTYDEINREYGDENEDGTFDDLPAEDFYSAIICCNKIKDEKYKQLLLNFDMHYLEFEFENIDIEKINILINMRIIPMNKKNLKFMRDNYSNNIINFILYNITDYVYKILDEQNFDFNEALDVINSKTNDNNKIKILELTKNKVSVANKEYSIKLKKYILKNNFDNNDLEYLINNYIYESMEIKSIIRDLCTVNINEIINSGYHIHFDLFISLIESNRFENCILLSLLINSLNNMNYTEIYNILSKLKFYDLIDILNGTSKNILCNEINSNFLEALRDKQYINSYEEVASDNVKYYKIIDKENK